MHAQTQFFLRLELSSYEELPSAHKGKLSHGGADLGLLLQHPYQGLLILTSTPCTALADVGLWELSSVAGHYPSRASLQELQTPISDPGSAYRLPYSSVA